MNHKLAHYYMEKYDLDAIIATQPVSLRYFCKFDCWVTNYSQEWMGKPGGSNSNAILFCILAKNDYKVLIVPTGLAPFTIDTDINEARFFGGPYPMAKSGPGMNELSMNENELNQFDKKLIKILEKDIFSEPVSALESVIKEQGLNSSKIGFELRGFNEGIFNKITEKLHTCSFKDCTEIIRLIRMIKTDKEIFLLSESAELNESALQQSARLMKAETTFKDVYDKFKNVVESNDGIIEHFIFSSYGYGVCDNRDYLFKKNHFTLLDSGASLSNYISDLGVTVFLDKPDKEYMEIYNRIYEGLIIGLESLKIGTLCSKVNNNIIGYLDKYNIHKTETHGHGIGLQPTEYPIISSSVQNFIYDNGFEKGSADFKLEENMVVALEVPYYISGKGSFIAEINALVTKRGYQLLTSQDRKTPIINY